MTEHKLTPEQIKIYKDRFIEHDKAIRIMAEAAYEQAFMLSESRDQIFLDIRESLGITAEQFKVIWEEGKVISGTFKEIKNV